MPIRAEKTHLASLCLLGLALPIACAGEATPTAVAPPPPPPSIVATTAPPPVAVAPVMLPPSAPVVATLPGSTAKPSTPWKGTWPKGWTDPRVVAAIAASCDFVPVSAEPDDPGGGGAPENVFACALGFEQACDSNECDDESHACKGACESTCGSCAAACTKGCGACEAACADAACRQRCATTTATCKDACTRTIDHCATAGCAGTAKTCQSMRDARSKKNHCDARCNTYTSCRIACKDPKTEEACSRRCEDALAPGYQACWDHCGATGGGELTVARCRRGCSEASPCSVTDCH